MFRAPYLPEDELRATAREFLTKHNPEGTIPVNIELIIEAHFGMDIVPVPGLQDNFDVVAFITRDLQEIRVDEYVHRNRINRYRFSLAHEFGHRLLHPDLWQEIQFSDIESWKSAITDSISEQDYSRIEFQANFFAGLVLVPPSDLRRTFDACVERARQSGIDIAEVASGAKDTVESYIAREFQVSRDVVHRRLDADGLWKCG